MLTEGFRSTKNELECDLTQGSPFLHDDYLCQSLRALFFTCGQPQSTDVWYSHIFGVLLQLSPKKNNIAIFEIESPSLFVFNNHSRISNLVCVLWQPHLHYFWVKFVFYKWMREKTVQ